MLWIYIALGTVGVIFLVPSVLQAIDGASPGRVFGFVGFAGTVFGLAGPLITLLTTGWGTALLASTAVGLAAGVLHTELLAALGRSGTQNRATSSQPKSDRR